MRFLESLRGAGSYLQTAFVAVLLAPVLPDIAVDVFGDWIPASLLRILAVAVLLSGCLALYSWRWHQERKWAAAAASEDFTLHKVEPGDVLILGWGPRSDFRPAAERPGDLELPEYLVRWTQPSTVILVSATAVPSQIEKNLKAAGIRRVHVVSLPDPYDPEPTLPEVANQVKGLLETNNLVNKKINVDITSGTVIMSLAMLRLALLVNATVVYVWSQQENGKRIPHTQRSKAFDPRDVLPVTR
jgi:hypothetical protein